jgi:transcriptional regulator with XRE-family HTH domain
MNSDRQALLLKAFGRRVAWLRGARQLDLRACASVLGIAHSTLANVEKATEVPTLLTVARIAEGFGVALADLVDGIDRVQRRGRPGPGAAWLLGVEVPT